MKMVGTSLTVGSGGSAGVFAPSLVIGGFIGSLVWILTNYFLPGWIPVPAPLVVVGMMAFFAGVGRAPIAVILMVSEMTGTLAILAPSMAAVALAYYITGPKYTIYKSQVLTRSESPAHIGEYNIPLLMKIPVADAMNPNVVTLSENESVSKAYNLMIEKGFRGIPVVESGELCGIVTFSDLMRVQKEQMQVTSIKDIMTRSVITVYPDESLFKALNKMVTSGTGRLPVIEKNSGKLLGILTRTDIIHAYDRVLRKVNH
jgi:CIC family chloride channel protein